VLTFADRWEADRTVDVGITTVLVGRELAIATIPGEPFHRLQTAWKSQTDVPIALFYGYTWSAGGTWAGYIPDLRSAAHGGYGADASTRVEVGAGERIMLRHLSSTCTTCSACGWRSRAGRDSVKRTCPAAHTSPSSRGRNRLMDGKNVTSSSVITSGTRNGSVPRTTRRSGAPVTELST
jgi:hypothetical protein